MQVIPVSKHSFIIYKDLELDKQFLNSLNTFSSVNLSDENYFQFEINPYRIWNSIFNELEPIKNFEKLLHYFSSPHPGLEEYVEQQVVKGRSLVAEFNSKSLLENPFSFSTDKWEPLLRPGQFRAVKYVTQNAHSGIISLPGGYGKTRTGIALIESLNPLDNSSMKTTVFVPNEVVKRYWLKEAEQIPLAPKIKKKIIKRMSFITYKAASRDNKSLDESQLILLDEVHEINDVILDILKEKPSLKIGLTASPQFSSDIAEKAFIVLGPAYPLKTEEIIAHHLPSNKINYFEAEVNFTPEKQTEYFCASNDKERFKIASQNPNKESVVAYLLKKHTKQKIILMGEYLNQLEELAKRFNLPLITGKSTTARREKIYRYFNEDTIDRFISSSITNQAINLPEADCLIQVSGKYLNSQEEIQRLGRILRKKKRQVYFYSIITQGTVEEYSAVSRKSSLSELGIKTKKLSEVNED